MRTFTIAFILHQRNYCNPVSNWSVININKESRKQVRQQKKITNLIYIKLNVKSYCLEEGSAVHVAVV